MLCNVVEGGESAFPEGGELRKVYGSTLLALPVGGWGSNFQEKALPNT